LAHVRDVGAYLGRRLHAVAAQSPLVRDVRGMGMMWGVELVEEVAASDVVAALWAHGLLTVPAGRNTVRFLPPLIVEQVHVDEAVSAFDAVLKATATV